MLHFDRKTARLRWRRVSNPGARYFLTACVKDRLPVLSGAQTGAAILNALHVIHDSMDADVLAATVMPDHVHILCAVGQRLTIGQVTAKLKNLGRDCRRATWRWQVEAFEHRLRHFERAEDDGFYIFMNPYRAGLCPLSGRWPLWFCPQPEYFQFATALTGARSVPPKWLRDFDGVASRVISGE